MPNEKQVKYAEATWYVIDYCWVYVVVRIHLWINTFHDYGASSTLAKPKLKERASEITRSNECNIYCSWVENELSFQARQAIGSQAWRDTLHDILWISIPFQSTTSHIKTKCTWHFLPTRLYGHFLSTRLCISLTHICQYNAYNDLARATFIELATFIINSECDRMIHTWPCELLLACQDVISHLRCQIEIWLICRYTCECAKQLPLYRVILLDTTRYARELIAT